jgi:hypothetical protein
MDFEHEIILTSLCPRSQRNRQQRTDRADRSVSGIWPALTETGWKKASGLVQGWEQPIDQSDSNFRWTRIESDVTGPGVPNFQSDRTAGSPG